MQPTPANIEMRQLIRTKSHTPGGFSLADAKGMPGAALAPNHTDRMIKTGELVKVKVTGYYLRFVKTQEMADALTIALKSMPKRPRKPDRPKGSPPAVRTSPLRRFVVASSAAPTGTTMHQCAHLDVTTESFYKCVTRLAGLGLLVKVKVTGWPLRYFASPDDAAAWQAATAPRVAPRVVKPPKPKKPKPPKVAKVKAAKPVKILKTSRPQLAKPANLSIGEITFLRQAASKLPVLSTIHKDAAIVYPKSYKFSSRPMEDRHAVAVPFVRIGSKDWKKGVGCGA